MTHKSNVTRTTQSMVAKLVQPSLKIILHLDKGYLIMHLYLLQKLKPII
jgi:hypothetical protein